ncbi:MAG: sensor histidine kinase, partial [Mycobacteriales bacterium]
NTAKLNSDAIELTQALQAERAAAVTVLAGNLTPQDAQFSDRAAETDATVSAAGAATTGAQRSLDTLTPLRGDVTKRSVENAAAMQRYDRVIGSVLAVMDAGPGDIDDTELADRLRGSALFSHYAEAGAQAAYLLYTATVSSGFDPGSYRSFLARLAEQEAYLAQFNQVAGNDDRRLVARRLSPERLSGVTDAESAAVRAGESGEIGIEAQQWQSSAGIKTQLVDALAQDLSSRASDAAASKRLAQLLYAVGAALLGLALVALSIIVTLRIARSMSHGLGKLRNSALDVAELSLPDVVEQLRDIDASRLSGPKVAKVRAEATMAIEERLDRRPTDEIGEVTQAFHLVHREAIDIAIQQAQLRLSVAATFVNLARRSQLLVDRLIRLIDKLEHTEKDPDRLSELFQLDHLVTRMRRNDESLLVLAGAEAGRRWTRAAGLADVLRAASAEIEQYTRVKIADVVPVAVAAHAVSDVVHLIAELAENATNFSPPRTDVIVQTRILRGFIVIDIRDQGIGMAVEQLEELNERLAKPHTANVQLSRMMGLYVVAKLAARHDVTVSLTSAKPQGTIATVTLPATLLQVSEREPEGNRDETATAMTGSPQLEIAATGPPSEAGDTPPRRTRRKGAPLPASEPGTASNGDNQSTEFVRPSSAADSDRGHKHWRYGEPTKYG